VTADEAVGINWIEKAKLARQAKTPAPALA
jgi:hypothetical protein